VKSSFDNAIGISTILLMIIIVYPILPIIASGYPFVPYQTIKNQINNRVNKTTISRSSESQITAAAEDNTISNNSNSIHGDSTSNSIGNNVAILNFYDDVKSQFTNAKPILDKYGFKGTL